MEPQRKGLHQWDPDFLWTRILEVTRILCRMDGEPPETSRPKIKWGSICWLSHSDPPCSAYGTEGRHHQVAPPSSAIEHVAPAPQFADDSYLMRMRNSTRINQSRREDRLGGVLTRQGATTQCRARTWRELLSETANPRGARSSNDPTSLFPSLQHHTFSPKGVAGLSFTARNILTRPTPERAETRSCPRRAQFHRARSASKKDGLAAPYSLLPRSLVSLPHGRLPGRSSNARVEYMHHARRTGNCSIIAETLWNPHLLAYQISATVALG